MCVGFTITGVSTTPGNENSIFSTYIFLSQSSFKPLQLNKLSPQLPSFLKLIINSVLFELKILNGNLNLK